MGSGLFYGMPGTRKTTTGKGSKAKRERRPIDRKAKGERLGAMLRASNVARAVRGGAEPDTELIKLQEKLTPAEFEATLRVLAEAPGGVPRSLRELVKEQPAPAAPSQP